MLSNTFEITTYLFSVFNSYGAYNDINYLIYKAIFYKNCIVSDYPGNNYIGILQTHTTLQFLYHL